MSIRKRIELVLASVFFGLLLATLAGYYFVIDERFAALEQQGDAEELARTQLALEQELADLQYAAEDYGYWDDTYEFVAAPADEFLTANFAPDELEFMGVHLVVVYGNDGAMHLLGQRRLDLATEPLKTKLADAAWRNLLLQVVDEVDGVVVGTSVGPMALSVQPIVGTDGTKPSRGHIVFGRLLEGSLIERLSQLLGRELRVAERGANTLAGPAIQHTTEVTRYSIPLPAMMDGPVYEISFVQDRSIRQQSRLALFGFLGVALLLMLVSLLVIRHLLQRFVVDDLNQLTQTMSGVSGKDERPPNVGGYRDDEIGRLAQEFTAMLARIEAHKRLEQRYQAQLRESEKLKVLGSLTGSIAHEFNNLLTIIIGNLELVLGTPLSAEQTEDLRTALTTSERAAQQMRHLLAYTQNQILNPREVDLVGFVQDQLSEIRTSIDGCIQLDADFQVRECPVDTDPKLLKNAIASLIENAKEAMPQGGRLRITISDLAPEQSCEGMVGVAISDTGTGMSRQVAANAFEPFFTTKDGGAGLGLGLSMAKGFAKQSGGDVVIHSEEHRGTTVTLCLPLRKSKETLAA